MLFSIFHQDVCPDKFLILKSEKIRFCDKAQTSMLQLSFDYFHFCGNSTVILGYVYTHLPAKSGSGIDHRLQVSLYCIYPSLIVMLSAFLILIFSIKNNHLSTDMSCCFRL